jgi:hypothetical protein
MPPQASAMSSLISIAVLVVVGVVIVLRNLQPRRLRVELLWIRPTILLAMCCLYFFKFQPGSPTDIAGLAISFAIGAALGWWRGSLTRIDVDPTTDTAMQQASPLGVLLILGLLALRSVLRVAVQANASSLPVSLDTVTGWLLALAVGVVVLQQLEIWLRAQRVMAQARAGKS